MRHASGLALAVLVLAPPAALRGDEWSHQYPIRGRADLHVKTDDGSVTVEAADTAEVAARVTTKGWAISPEEVTITETQSGDRVDIEVRLPRHRHWWPSAGHREVAVTLRVPRELDLDVRTGDGSVTLPAVSGNLQIFTGDGSITAEGARGVLRLRTGDGSIRATGIDGRLEADTGDGRMDVRGRFEALDLHTGDGGIVAEVEEGSRVSAAWQLRSGDGGITLRLPVSLGAEIDAHTGDGSIVFDLPVTVAGELSRTNVRGRLGAGGPPIKVTTGDGSIRLQRL
jgi:hypothetical protein